MKKFITGIIIVLFTFQISFADEGMWLLTMLNKTYPDMKAQGFKLTPEDIYSINNPSIKDAIVIFGGFCTGEIVSDKGLIFTNHHCGFGSIQSHSTVEHDYLTDGFWAQSFAEELPNPGLFVKFLIKFDDVTAVVLKGVTDNMSEEDREATIKKNIDKIEKKSRKEYDADKGYETVVQSFFDNNQYFLIVYQKYTDVRLVGAPPTSIGKFGGDTDNWMWTRHTGDFSIFRVYSAPDGSPAEYSTNNVPLKPKYSLPVSVKGVKEGDFAMIMGYPGGTDRYKTSFAIEEVMNITNTYRAKIRGERQEVLWADMMADKEVYIKYASKYARSSNYWKYSIGQNKGLKRLKVIDKKRKLEADFTTWIAKDPQRQAKYKDVLPTFKTVYNERKDYEKAYIYVRECLISGTEYILFGRSAIKLYDVLKSGDADAIKKSLETFKNAGEEFFKDYNAPTDYKASLVMLDLFMKDMDKNFYPDFIKDVTNTKDYIDNIFNTSILTSKDRFDAFVNNPVLETLGKDAGFIESKSAWNKYDEIKSSLKPFDKKLEKAERLWLEALMEMYPDKVFYPDANFTMRLTYGTVGGYSPQDAVDYKYYTTLKGIMEKEDPDNPEFIVPQKLKDIYAKKDYGMYGDKDGSMHVCFLSNNDITGGNSGSPIINGNGELIGLAFDGNWEAMSGDIAFEPELQRTINVDVRYVLLVIDKVGNCHRLIDELNIAK